MVFISKPLFSHHLWPHSCLSSSTRHLTFPVWLFYWTHYLKPNSLFISNVDFCSEGAFHTHHQPAVLYLELVTSSYKTPFLRFSSFSSLLSLDPFRLTSTLLSSMHCSGLSLQHPLDLFTLVYYCFWTGFLLLPWRRRGGVEKSLDWCQTHLNHVLYMILGNLTSYP